MGNSDGGQTYTVTGTPIYFSWSGGSVVTITIKDGAGNSLGTLAASTQMYLPIGYEISVVRTNAPTFVVEVT